MNLAEKLQDAAETIDSAIAHESGVTLEDLISWAGLLHTAGYVLAKAPDPYQPPHDLQKEYQGWAVELDND